LQDPNRSPFVGVPLIDTNKLLEAIVLVEVDGAVPTSFPLPFSVVNMEGPRLSVNLACIDNNSAGELVEPLPSADFVLASENARVRSAYTLSLGDAVEEDFVRLLFLPKSSGGTSGAKRATLERQDYRELKRQRLQGLESEGRSLSGV
jgi:hypothetical protein